MKKLLLLLAVTFLGVATASAATLCGASPAENVLAGGYSCSIGGLTFSDFSSNMAGAEVNIMGAAVLPHQVNLLFNPNLDAGDDIYFYFKVSGAYINMIDLSVNGAGNSVEEDICSGPWDSMNSCTGTLLATISANGDARPIWSEEFPATNSIYVFKDIGAGSHFSSFGQSFHMVPEPMTFVLLGSGLLGLGLLRRRKA